MSDASYDVVVVGMGGAGLCAALSYAETAGEHGRRRASPFSSARQGRSAAGRRATRRRASAVDDDNELDPTFAPTPSPPTTTPRRRRRHPTCGTLERETPASSSASSRSAASSSSTTRTASPPASTAAREAAPTGGGRSIVESLAARASSRSQGVEIHYETEAVDLVTDARGAIAGITARGRDGYLLTLSAPAVDPRVRRLAEQQGAHGPVPRSAGRGHAAHRARRRLQHGRRPAHGDGGRRRRGRAVRHGPRRALRHAHHVPDAVVLSYPYGILVNGKAERFLARGRRAARHDVRAVLLRRSGATRTTRPTSIGDQSMVEVPYFELLNTTDKEPETADTLAELAGKLGLDPAALEATVRSSTPRPRSRPFDPTTKDGKATTGHRAAEDELGAPHRARAVRGMAADVRRLLRVRRRARPTRRPGSCRPPARPSPACTAPAR